MSDIVVELTWPEINAACEVALFRHVSNESRGLSPRYGAPADFFDGLLLHMRGCLGEIATAKAFNLYWTGVAGIREPDVGGVVEVRVRSKEHYRLIVHDRDKDDSIMVLAFINDPKKVRLRGWIEAKDGKAKEFYADPAGGRPAYFVPQTSLHDIRTLSDRINRRAA